MLSRPEIEERHHLTTDEVEDTLRLLQTDALHIVVMPTPPIALRDPKDDKVLALALGGRADFLVTGDEDLLSVEGNPDLSGFRIITPLAFLALLKTKQGEGRSKKPT